MSSLNQEKIDTLIAWCKMADFEIQNSLSLEENSLQVDDLIALSTRWLEESTSAEEKAPAEAIASLETLRNELFYLKDQIEQRS